MLKRIVSIILAVLMLLSISACKKEQKNGISNSQGAGEQQNQNGKPTEGKPSTDNPGDEPDEDAPDYSMDELSIASGFGDGLAFANYDYDTICINKKGQHVFTLATGYDLDSTIRGFKNGLAIVRGYDSNREEQFYFCRKDGSIVKPESVGATIFAISPGRDLSLREDMFQAGYILTYNIQYNAEGIVDVMEAGILSSNMEWIVPLSEEFYSTIMRYEESGNVSYHAGYLIIPGYCYLNLRTGKEDMDFSKLYSASDVEHISDFWEGQYGNVVYDNRDGKSSNRQSVLDLSMYDEITSSFSFENGIAPVFFNSGAGETFSLLREDGSLCFEPVAAGDSWWSYDSTTDIYLIARKDGNKNLIVDLFNTDGKIKTHTFETAEYEGANAEISDGVIKVSYMIIENNSVTVKYSLFTLDFEPLF